LVRELSPGALFPCELQFQTRYDGKKYLHCPAHSWFPVQAVSKKLRWIFFLGNFSVAAEGMLREFEMMEMLREIQLSQDKAQRSMMLNLVEDKPSPSIAREIKSVILRNLPAYKPYSSTELQFIIRKLVI